jgi:putative zinc-dependent peptidase DUF5700
MASASDQMRALEQFFLQVLDGRLSGDSAVTTEGMKFFGVQGPWYTVGHPMWREVERRFGRERVITDACRPAQLRLDYNRAVARDPKALRWSDGFARRLATVLARRS